MGAVPVRAGHPAAHGPVAVADINSALAALAEAQRNGDFEGIGRAQADLQDAIEAYQAAGGATSAPASPTG